MELLTSVIFGNALVSLLSKVSSHPARPPLSALVTDHTGQMLLRPSEDENKKYILNSSGLWLHIPHSSFLCGSHLPYAAEPCPVAYRWVCCGVQWVQGEQPSWFSEFSAGGWLADWLAGSGGSARSLISITSHHCRCCCHCLLWCPSTLLLLHSPLSSLCCTACQHNTHLLLRVPLCLCPRISFHFFLPLYPLIFAAMRAHTAQ